MGDLSSVAMEIKLEGILPGRCWQSCLEESLILGERFRFIPELAHVDIDHVALEKG